MTMYTENVDYRMRTVFAILFVLSVIAGWLLYDAIPAYPRVVVPATLMIYGSLFWLFDGFLWKLPVIRLLNSGIPLLAGTWKGTMVHKSDGRKVDATLTIKQTWSKLDLILETPEAVSMNTLAGLNLFRDKGVVLTWVYQMEGGHAHSLTEPGRGIIELRLDRTSPKMTFTGSFMDSIAEDDLTLAFEKSGFFWWNPKPF
jgi:hypothetical protein